MNTAQKRWKERGHDESFWEYAEVLMATFETLLTSLSPLDFDQAIIEVFES